MSRLALFLALSLAGCATPPPEPTMDTGTIQSETGEPRNRARIHTELASLYFEKGNMGVALEELRIATSADPTYALAHGMFGVVYMELRENVLAEASFKRGLSLAPQDPDLNHNYGWFLCQTGRETESVKYFLQAVRNPLYATPSRSFAAAGVCALRKDEVKDAEQYFQRALAIDPNDPASLLHLGQIRFREGRYPEARQFVTHFQKLVQPTAESLWLALRVERKLGERAAEAGFAGQLRRLFPGSREYQLLQRGEFD